MKKLLLVTAIAGLALATVGTTAASATARAIPRASLSDGHGGVLAEAQLESDTRIIVCDRNADHRYAMAKVRYQGHTYQYANYYKNQDCLEQRTRRMSHGKIELWACVSKPYKVKFDHCGPKKTVVRP
ncbi:hypothetical protein ACIBO2_13410 [Nonomuraea sp. NPDC050022]|uniref:hypothetical protein n=1 Tax=unclassified Nonomuraea TaxID=2593643 RepID=UPI0033C12F9A